MKATQNNKQKGIDPEKKKKIELLKEKQFNSKKPINK